MGTGLLLFPAAGSLEEDRPPALSDYQIQQNSLPLDSRIDLYPHNTKTYVSMQNESGYMPTDYLNKLIFYSRFANYLC